MTPPTTSETQTAISGAFGVVQPGTPPPSGIRRLKILLIRPSKYDDDGYVMRYVRGVLPSNTLAVSAGLTRQVDEAGLLGRVRIDVRMLDEHVQKVDPRKLARDGERSGTRTIVALCGVQTNQFPRATDLALEFHSMGVPVMLGGFHVSGSIAMSTSGMPAECRSLIDAGVTLVKGEVEERWADLLRDAMHRRLKPFYEVRERPDLSSASLPLVDPKLMRRFAYRYMGTIDAGRGCPFNCSFCTIINVQGHTMRCRSAASIKDCVRQNASRKIDYYFFTDDNFSRNPNWEAIFDALIELKRDEGINIQFMMQIDVRAYRIGNFVTKAAAAGCSQVFIGMETLNPANIAEAGKRQNRVEEYSSMIDAWHAEGVACHVGYIIGFPFDTVESVRDDVRRLREEIRVDQASFFMLVPIPGSRDHAEMVRRGEWMDDDYNRFDSFHPTTRHPRMSAAEWDAAYRHAWRDFYSVDSMKSVLSRANRVTYWGLLKNFVWYRHSTLVEDAHPMVCGFFRLKDRKQRRPGYAPESFWAHYRQRAKDVRHWVRGVVKLYFEMQDVWLATRGRSGVAQDVIEQMRRRQREFRDQLSVSASRAERAFNQRLADLRCGVEEAWLKTRDGGDLRADLLPAWRRWASRLNPVAIRTHTRAHLDEYWRQTYRTLRRGLVFRINPLRLLANCLRDVKLCLRFSLAVLLAYAK